MRDQNLHVRLDEVEAIHTVEAEDTWGVSGFDFTVMRLTPSASGCQIKLTAATCSFGFSCKLGAWRNPEYVVLTLSDKLKNESLHSGLSGTDLHDPKEHGHDLHTDTTRKIWIPARLWEPSVVVAAARTVIGDTPVYELPDGNGEAIVAFMRPPVGFDHLTMVYKVLLATASGAVGEGIAQIVAEITGYDEGDHIGAVGGGVTNDVTIPASLLGFNNLVVATLNISAVPLDPKVYYAIQFIRRGDLGTDTYAGELYLIAAQIEFTHEY